MTPTRDCAHRHFVVLVPRSVGIDRSRRLRSCELVSATQRATSAQLRLGGWSPHAQTGLHLSRLTRVYVLTSPSKIVDVAPTPRVRVALGRKGLQMFKLGKTYKFWMWEDSHDGGIVTMWGSCKVTKVDMPLVTIDQADQAGTETIINTHSPTFSRAELEPSSALDQGQRAQVLAVAMQQVLTHRRAARRCSPAASAAGMR